MCQLADFIERSTPARALDPVEDRRDLVLRLPIARAAHGRL